MEGGRKAALPDMEEELVAWIESLRVQNLRVTHSNVRNKALEFAQSRGTEEFHASDGWLQKFLKRHSFSLRRRTTVGQRFPCNLITKLVGFTMSTRKLYHSKNCPLSFIGNMDEMHLWLDMPRYTTITR